MAGIALLGSLAGVEEHVDPDRGRLVVEGLSPCFVMLVLIRAATEGFQSLSFAGFWLKENPGGDALAAMKGGTGLNLGRELRVLLLNLADAISGYHG